MDSRKNNNVIVFSISPEYAHAILAGKKSVEFRRNGAPTKITHIVIYSTKPDQEIVGYSEVENIIEESPNKLWSMFGKFGHINHEDFKSYYLGTTTGKCYLIKKSYRFARPIPLTKCKSFSKAPQSFLYIEQTEWNNLKRKKKKEINPIL